MLKLKLGPTRTFDSASIMRHGVPTSKAPETRVHMGSHRFHPATRTRLHTWNDVSRFNPAARRVLICTPLPTGSRLSLPRQVRLTVYARPLLCGSLRDQQRTTHTCGVRTNGASIPGRLHGKQACRPLDHSTVT